MQRGHRVPSLVPYLARSARLVQDGSIFWKGSFCTGLWDPYPKARLHLLFVPAPGTLLQLPHTAAAGSASREKSKIQTTLTGGISARQSISERSSQGPIQSVSDIVWGHHSSELQAFHREAKAVTEAMLARLNVETGPEGSLGTFGPLQMCYHLVPSLRPLHLHGITLDMASESTKTRKHLQSFLSAASITPEELEQVLKLRPSQPLDKEWCIERSRAGLATTIQC